MKFKNLTEKIELDQINEEASPEALQKIRDKIKFHQEQIKLLNQKFITLRMK